MKKYMFCFLLFAATSLLCLGIGFVITRDSVQPVSYTHLTLPTNSLV